MNTRTMFLWALGAVIVLLIIGAMASFSEMNSIKARCKPTNMYIEKRTHMEQIWACPAKETKPNPPEWDYGPRDR